MYIFLIAVSLSISDVSYPLCRVNIFAQICYLSQKSKRQKNFRYLSEMVALKIFKMMKNDKR